MMPIVRAAAQSLRGIRGNALRSGLAAVAIAVSVATMLSVTVALNGIRDYAELTTARTFGADTFLIAQVAAPGRIPRRQLLEQLATHPPLSRAEGRQLQRYAQGVTRYAPNAQARAVVVRGSRTLKDAPVTGTTAALAGIRDLNIAEGRFFTEDEDRRGAAVALIGAEVADALFAPEDALGRTLRLAGRQFVVIGVQERVGSGGGALDKYVWIPIRAHERAFGAPRSLQFFAKADSAPSPQAAEDHARTSLRAIRAIAPGRPDNFDVLAPDAARGFVANLSGRIGAAAGPISFMALIAAIVVVTNTMLVSVTQRTREIGLRRALGARRGDIMREVVAESVMLSVFGGGAGVLVVLVLIAAAGGLAPVPLSVPASAVAVALVAAGASGLLSGWLPALRAARLDVIEAIRSE